MLSCRRSLQTSSLKGWLNSLHTPASASTWPEHSRWRPARPQRRPQWPSPAWDRPCCGPGAECAFNARNQMFLLCSSLSGGSLIRSSQAGMLPPPGLGAVWYACCCSCCASHSAQESQRLAGTWGCQAWAHSTYWPAQVRLHLCPEHNTNSLPLTLTAHLQACHCSTGGCLSARKHPSAWLAAESDRSQQRRNERCTGSGRAHAAAAAPQQQQQKSRPTAHKQQPRQPSSWSSGKPGAWWCARRSCCTAW